MLIGDYRFMSVILGRWPLIPEQNCTASLPNGIIGTQISDVDAPNVFSERGLQIKLTKISFTLLTSNDGKPSTDPVIIGKHTRRLKEELLDELPPTFRLYDADEKWDEKIPNLRRQREMFRISVFATICLLLRPVIVQPPSDARALSPSDRKLVIELRTSLTDATIEMLESVRRLHILMGGKHNRFFLLSFFTLEPAVLLGMCLIKLDIWKTVGKQGSASATSRGNTLVDQDRLKQGRKKMDEAVGRLEVLSEVSSIARTGLKVLKKIVARLDVMEMASFLVGTNRDPYTRSASYSQPSKIPISGPDADHPITLVTSEDLAAAASMPPLSRAVTAEENFTKPITPPYSEHSHRSPDLPLLDKVDGWGSTGDLGIANTTSNPGDWDLDFGDDFLSNDFGSLTNPTGSLNGPPQLMITGINAGIPQYAHSYAPSYANMTWPSWPQNWACNTLIGTTNPAQSTPFAYANPTESNAPVVMNQDFDWGLMSDDRVTDF